MAAFEYLALDGAGRTKKGILTGDSSRQVRTQLRGQGFYPIEVNAVAETAGRIHRLGRQGVSPGSLALITRQMATLLRAGIPLEETLKAMEMQFSRRLQSILAGVRTRITEGASLYEAMREYPAVFPELYCVMVEAGEASGGLEEVLDRLADYTEASQALRQKLSMALVYPALVTIVAAGVVTVLLTYVVPEVIRVFEQSGQQLPLLTLWLIYASEFLRSYGLQLLAGVGLILLAGRWLLNRPRVRYHWHRMLLKTPLLGRVLRTVDAARLGRTLAILTRSGVPLLEALTIASRMVRYLPLRRSVEQAAETVREGGRLYSALERAGGFPPILIHMLAAGEDSGELENMLERIAAHQERELETAMSMLTTLLEPLVILIMGAVVLIIVLAVVLPIFDMNQLVGV